MGTQAEKAQCEKTTFPAEMVYSNQGNVCLAVLPSLLSCMLLHPTSLAQPFLWRSWESLFRKMASNPQLCPFLGMCISCGTVLPQFLEEEWRVLEGMSRDLQSLCFHLFRYFRIAWNATADISTLRDSRSWFVLPQSSIQRGSDKAYSPCASTARWLGLGFSSVPLQFSHKTQCLILGESLSLSTLSSPFLLCHYGIWCLPVF